MTGPADAAFVLVRPRNPNNIGAAARAMANFGLNDLRLVEPYAPVWNEARSAVGASAVLKGARATTLAAAISDAALVLGTGDGRRALRRPVVDLPGLGSFLRERLPAGGRLALLFGSEKTGLRNAELAHCAAVLRVPTRPECPSMNLGQAAAVIAYELSRPRAEAAPRQPRAAPASAGQTEDLVRWAVSALDGLGAMEGVPAESKAERVRSALLRWSVTRQDAGFLRALLKRVAAASELGRIPDRAGKP